MSNHDGSYLLRDVLRLQTKVGIWQHTSRAATQGLVVSVVNLACRRYDCNAGEILDGHEELGICYVCWKPAEQLQHGLCGVCGSSEVDDLEEA